MEKERKELLELLSRKQREITLNFQHFTNAERKSIWPIISQEKDSVYIRDTQTSCTWISVRRNRR